MNQHVETKLSVNLNKLALLRNSRGRNYPDLLDFASPDAERIFVGKTPGHHVVEQELINEILVDRAQRHLMVVRLKGGVRADVTVTLDAARRGVGITPP